MSKSLLVLLFIVILLSPFGTIWAVNTLFNVGIAYTFKTWLAAIILQGLLTVNVKNTK